MSGSEEKGLLIILPLDRDLDNTCGLNYLPVGMEAWYTHTTYYTCTHQPCVVGAGICAQLLNQPNLRA